MGTNYYERRNLYSDEILVAAYLECESQVKAAEQLGVSRETVARAVRRAAIPLAGTKNNGKIQRNQKISDSELKNSVKAVGLISTAHKYGLSAEQCYRRARKLGINVKGEMQRVNWKNRLFFYGGNESDFDESITLKSVHEKFNGVCQICGKPVNWGDIVGGHIRRLYPTVDHIIPLSKGGAHTWSNVQLAHMMCNSGKRDSVDLAANREV